MVKPQVEVLAFGAYAYINNFVNAQCQYIKNKTLIAQRVIFRFLPNLRRLNKNQLLS